jgi:hypothetical protein
MRHSATQDNPEAIRKTRLGLMDTALTEYLFAQRLSTTDLLTHIRNETPHVILPPIVGGIVFTVKAMTTLSQWATLVRDSQTEVRKSINEDSWESAVRAGFVAAVQEVSKNTESGNAAPWFDERVIQLALEFCKPANSALVHYVPCYLFEHGPPGFSVGSIHFVRGNHLVQQIQADLGNAVDWLKDESTAESTNVDRPEPLREFRRVAIQRMSSFPWVASISVAERERVKSQQRAEDAVRLAIAGLGLLMSPQHASEIGIVHEWNHSRRGVRLTLIRDHDIVSAGEFGDAPQVSASNEWVTSLLRDSESVLRWLGDAIDTAILASPEVESGAELRKSWINAVYWYYLGCCEVSDARATICYSSCLESMAVRDGAKAMFELCETMLEPKSDAMLVPSRKLTLEEAVKLIYRRGRSEVVHGGRFVLDEEYGFERRISAELSRHVLLLYQQHLESYEAELAGRAGGDRKDVFLKWLEAKRSARA